jgi:hypothetical protein
MHDVIGLVALLIVVALCVAIIIRLQLLDTRLDPLRKEISGQEILFQVPVWTKATQPWRFNFAPLKGMRRVELTLRADSIQLAYPSPRYGKLLATECILPIAGTRMSFGRARFSPFRTQRCIIIVGDQLGRTIEQAVFSKDHMQDVWDALVRVGVQAMSDSSS